MHGMPEIYQSIMVSPEEKTKYGKVDFQKKKHDTLKTGKLVAMMSTIQICTVFLKADIEFGTNINFIRRYVIQL